MSWRGLVLVKETALLGRAFVEALQTHVDSLWWSGVVETSAAANADMEFGRRDGTEWLDALAFWFRLD